MIDGTGKVGGTPEAATTYFINGGKAAEATQGANFAATFTKFVFQVLHLFFFFFINGGKTFDTHFFLYPALNKN